MSYLNQTIIRRWPATRCQAAVYALLNREWCSVDDIWRHRQPIYCAWKSWHGVHKIQRVGYGTISQVLRSLVQQGLAETKLFGKRPRYRPVKR